MQRSALRDFLRALALSSLPIAPAACATDLPAGALAAAGDLAKGPDLPDLGGGNDAGGGNDLSDMGDPPIPEDILRPPPEGPIGRRPAGLVAEFRSGGARRDSLPRTFARAARRAPSSPPQPSSKQPRSPRSGA